VRSANLTYLSLSALRDLERCHLEAPAGDYVECGVALGGSAILLSSVMDRGRQFHGYDVFGMIPPPGAQDPPAVHERYRVIASGASHGLGGQLYYGYRDDLYSEVVAAFDRFGVPVDGDRVQLHRGLFEETLWPRRSIAIAHIDCDWHDAVKLCLERIWPHLEPGGFVVADDYHDYEGARVAVDDFMADHPELRPAGWGARAHLVLRRRRGSGGRMVATRAPVAVATQSGDARLLSLPPLSAEASRDRVLKRLTDGIDAVLGPLVDTGSPVALVGFPNHPNVGDAAIWAGEVAWLRRRGADIAYACDRDGYSRRALARAVGDDGTILLHGGGNFGDIWPPHELLRERVVSDFPDHRIVSLPQTMRFEDPAALERARRCFDAHPWLWLLLRDGRSLRLAEEAFESRSALCADLAFALGPLGRDGAPVAARLWLSRTDRERTTTRLEPPAGAGSARGDLVDWLDDAHVPQRPRARRLRRTLLRYGRGIARRPPPAPALYRAHARVCDALAAERVAYGRRLLSRGEVVITDRLHAHILSVLLGIPHVLVDTGYGKLRTFHETWTAEVPFVRTATDATSALAVADELAASAVTRSPREV
jgi:pyruvyl transferase EpsO